MRYRPFFITFGVANIILISFLGGVLISKTIFKFNNYKKFEGKESIGFIGFRISTFDFRSPYGTFPFGLIEIPLVLMYLHLGDYNYNFYEFHFNIFYMP